jgi:hypothetical protein
LVQPSGQTRLQKTTRRGMAQHCRRFAWLTKETMRLR